VVRTIDGDTAVVAFRDARGRGTVTVRYLGVDTPESVHPDKPVECFGPQASHRNHAWATGRRVRLRFDVERIDPYGRLLAALVPDGRRRSLSERLVAEGLARVLAIAPNGADAPRLRRLEEQARTARRGLWGACGDALRSGT
jgi:micrococcal nuclease